MAEPLTLLQHRWHDDWLIGVSNAALWQAVAQFQQEIDRDPPSSLLLVEPDPVRFIAGFLVASAAHIPLCLGNPQWGQREWQQVFQQICPDRIWGTRSPLMADPAIRRPDHLPHLQPGWILIPTGGSSGQIRFAIHTWATLRASVEGFQHYFDCAKIYSCCVLPTYHVGGLIQVLRSFCSGGRLALFPFKAILAGSLPEFDPKDWFLSLVPTQLSRLLPHAAQREWLKRFQTVLLGGAPAWPSLLEQAQTFGIRLSPTYGMTETASQVATLKPDDFLRGISGCGRVLPHAQIAIASSHSPLTHSPSAPENPTIGPILVAAQSLALGYIPDSPLPIVGSSEQPYFQTDDIGYLDAEGYLHVVGRNSRKIITGGENVFPDEVEAALWATGLVADICVVGVSDRDWGEVVTAVYVPATPEVAPEHLKHALTKTLSPAKRPKRWCAVPHLPRTEQGKIDYRQVQQMAGDRVLKESANSP